MDTKTFFSILAVLVLVGVLANLMTGSDLPTSPEFTEWGYDYLETDACGVCTDGGLFGLDCIAADLFCLASGLINLVIFVGDSIITLGYFIFDMFAFFSGLTAFLTEGEILLPSPISFIAGIFVFFAWVFLLLEAIYRFKSVVFP